jgi:hypothetical protein
MNRREGPLPLTWPRILIYIALAVAVAILLPDASFALILAVPTVAILIELGIWYFGQRR